MLSAIARTSSEKRGPWPAVCAASRPSAATWFGYVFVAATASSGPALSGNTASAAAASAESGSFVIATVNAPLVFARSTYSTTSGVRPDWDSASTVEPAMSSSAP